MKAIVTGGKGFIGSHVVDRLIDMWVNVHVIDNESANNEKFYENPKACYYKKDICDEIGYIFDGAKVVFHLAAESRIGPCIEDPAKAVRTNVAGTCNVLQLSRQHGVDRVVYSSTSACYGLVNKPPFTEEMPRDCLNPYTVTKMSGEDLCVMYTKLYGLDTVSLRYFNVFGDRAPAAGPYAPVSGIFLRQHASNQAMTIVGDGMQRRDFVHVSDIVDANIAAALTENKEAMGEVFNVGSGSNCSILDVALLIGGKYEFVPARPGEARNTLADISKLRSILNCHPKVQFLSWLKGVLNDRQGQSSLRGHSAKSCV